MSLNVTVVTWSYIACVTDRRLTRCDGKILSERSTKLTCFDLQSGVRGFITYNGIGCGADGITPSDWIANLPLREGMSLKDLAELIKANAEPRIQALAPQFQGNPRHTFVIGAFVGAVPFLVQLSNYETLQDEGVKALAAPSLSIEFVEAKSLTSRGAFIMTGATPQTKNSDKKKLIELLDNNATPNQIVARTTKLIRDVSYRKDRIGTVGTSVLSGFWPQFGGADVASNVVGGSWINEVPNFITPGARYSNIYIGSKPTQAQRAMESGAASDGKGRIAEAPCRACGAVVPEGYRRCGVCDHPVESEKQS